jgi:hypothetical protein
VSSGGNVGIVEGMKETAEEIVFGDGEGWLLLGVGPFFYMGPQVQLGSEPGEDEEEEDDAPVFLKPCYRIHEGIARDRSGKDVEVLQCQPYGAGLLAFSAAVEIAHYETRVEIGDLVPADRGVLKQLMAQAEKNKAAIRQSRIGLVAAR